ncbi:probable rhodanese domain-containing dual specificity protein phosphatase isoform X2 [Saccostrea cucullata]
MANSTPRMLLQMRYDKYQRMDIDEILPGLYLSGCNPAENKDLMESFKITHIVNMASYFDNQFPKTIKYYKIKEEDLEETNLLQYFEKTFKFIDDARKTKGRVLVHCNAGISRAGTMITGYVMRTKGMTMTQAMEFAQSKRRMNPIDPNEGFMKQLKKYEEMLRKAKVLK